MLAMIAVAFRTAIDVLLIFESWTCRPFALRRQRFADRLAESRPGTICDSERRHTCRHIERY
jgi:hypothetical protein